MTRSEKVTGVSDNAGSIFFPRRLPTVLYCMDTRTFTHFVILSHRVLNLNSANIRIFSKLTKYFYRFVASKGQGITNSYSAELSDAVRIVHTSIGGAHTVGYLKKGRHELLILSTMADPNKQYLLSAARAGLLPFQQVRALVSMPPVSIITLL